MIRRSLLSLAAAVGLLLGATALPAAAAETGSITGTFQRGPGQPLAGTVGLRDRAGNYGPVAQFGADGKFRLDNVAVGEYRVAFYGPGEAVQYWPRQERLEQGQWVSVTAGGTAVVEETVLPLGELEVTVTDQATGQPLAGAVVDKREGPYSLSATTDDSGVARFGLVRAGTWTLAVWAKGYHWDSVDNLVVRADDTTRASRTLAKVPVLQVDFASAVTGGAVGKACVHISDADRPSVDAAQLKCAHGNGKLEIDYLYPGKYRLFAVPGDLLKGDGVHGSQWVGAEGGTGDAEQAQVIELKSGETNAVRVRFDGSGTISGSVTEAKTGAAVQEICPTVTPAFASSNRPWSVRCTYTEGRYTINDLGPYDWRVQFPDMTGKYAWQWSGEAVDRFAAAPVRVTAGANTALDARLKPAGKVTGQVFGNTVPFQYVSVNAYSARTGDPAGPDGMVWTNGRYQLAGLGTQAIKIGFNAARHQDWHPKPVHTTAGLTLYGLDLHATPEK